MNHKFISATHDKKTLTAMYKMADGTIYIRKGGTIPWRLQNPGDVRPNRSKGSEYLQPLRLAIADTANGKFSMFGSEEDGWETKKKLLKSPLYKDCTIPDMAEIYAPEKDNNNPEQYAKDVMAWSGVSGDLTIGDMDDVTLERVMQAMKKKEGYYNLKETRVEKWIYTTNVSITDGTRPISDCPLYVTLGSCEYAWKTNEYGDLPPIVHMSEGMNIEIKATNSKGEKETIYSATAGDKSKNIVLTKKFTQYKANTLADSPKVPREKSQPQPIEYVVQSGDVLSKIATRYNVSASELAENNGIKDANKIYPGQKIVIYGKKEPDYVDLSEQVPWEEKGQSYPVPSYSPSDEGRINTSEEKIPSAGGWNPETSSPKENSSGTTRGKNSSTENTASSSTQENRNTPPKEKSSTDGTKEKLTTVGGKNSGNAQAHVRLYQDEAPWMVTAIAEAEKYKGADENIIDDSENFHALVNAKFPDNNDMDGMPSAWCGSFINYCLQVNKYPMWRQPYKSQGVSWEKNNDRFVEIKEPVYGCITMLSHHVTLMYGLDKNKKGRFIGLGGNQGGEGETKPGGKRVFGGTIRFSSFSLRHARFFLPISYDKNKSGTILGEYDANELNHHFAINIVGTGDGVR